MIDIIGYWLSVSILSVPIPIAGFLIVSVIFAECYRSELEKKGLSHSEAARRVSKLPVIRHIEAVIEEWMLFVLMVLSFFQIICILLSLREFSDMTATGAIMAGISYVSMKMSSLVGFVAVIAAIVGVVPVTAKLCARFSLLKEKVEKL